MSVVKTGVALRRDTLEKLEEYMRAAGIRNRSRVISEALEVYLAERASLAGEGKIGGAILVYFDHRAQEALTELQHRYLDIVISNTHAHLDEENCIEAILVRGDVAKVKELISRLESLKGVKAVRFGFFKIT